LRASRFKRVTLPEELAIPEERPCFLPAAGKAAGFQCQVVDRARVLTCGIATTCPLARSLFFFGFTEEQALVAQVKNKGLVVFTGCGRPSIELITEMAGRLSKEPIYVIGGGLYFPITGGRDNRAGIQFQTILGTGKPPWHRITDDGLTRTIHALDELDPRRVLPSAHDSCDHSLTRMERELKAETQVLEAGETYRF